MEVKLIKLLIICRSELNTDINTCTNTNTHYIYIALALYSLSYSERKIIVFYLEEMVCVSLMMHVYTNKAEGEPQYRAIIIQRG